MNLKEIGEFGFIERFKPLFDNLVQDSQTGIGDDCAIIPVKGSQDWLITTDLLVEEVHFLRNAISPDQLGYKSLAVNLSDIAAMGGTPVGSFLSVAIPPDMEVEYLDAFMEGFHQISARYHTPLLGGDTTRSLKHLAINVCIVGKCPEGMARKRCMARQGDAVCVTGYLGDSAGGLQVLLHKIAPSDKENYLLHQHYQPEPRLDEGLFLANFPAVHAMMDISDGIASDLKHILKASSVSARIDLGLLPVSEPLCRVSAEQGWNVQKMAAAGGEDYELLVTIDETEAESVQREFKQKFGKPLVRIGSVTAGMPEIEWLNKSEKIRFTPSGFNHFQ